MIPGWLDAIEDEVKTGLNPGGRISARELADALGVSERCAVGYITLLASSGRLRIEAVSLPDEPALPTADARLHAAA